jgi:hypothetical protein
MNKRQYAILFSALVGVLTYGREWLLLVGAIPLPETSFFEGFPNLLSPVLGTALVMGFLFRHYFIAAWIAFYLPSLVAHHCVILMASGFFPMWPAFLGAHILLGFGLLALFALGAWVSRKYQAVQ